MFFKKLEKAEDRYREIEQLITLPNVVSNNKLYSSLMKEYSLLTPIIDKFREYKAEEKEMRESDEMMRDSSLDSELRELAEEEYKLHKENVDLHPQDHAGRPRPAHPQARLRLAGLSPAA